ncbi:PREDICTED: thiamine transporter 2-like isoform X2 [Wasmannia auropunctata]|uniref:thiamine transporter 2-like isoform X2 n=1 Tax=Wasmannia auropunctata TaxID=64793 RepID=UPI0005EEE4F9|nr:PREDICTED: thiamine transporter 2-like isoform X2 [Wasmannia auropunctata]
MYWLKISCMLCMFGCFKDFRPSESFLTDYLTGPWKNFTADQVNHEIYPVTTYCYSLTLILMFLITDFIRYKPIIILCGLSGVITFLLIPLGRIVLVLQISKFFFGLFMSAEVAYYTYIYAKVDRVHYQEVTSHTKAASLFGRSMSGIVAQLTASFHLLNYHQLNYLTLSAFIIATFWSLFLPSVGHSIYFHSDKCDDISDDEENSNATVQTTNQSQQVLSNSRKSRDKSSKTKPGTLFHKIKNAYALLWKHFVLAYTNYRVIKWSAWWALSTCGYLMVATYSQLLWQTAVKPGDMIYNGAVDFAYAILGAVMVFSVGKIPFNWVRFGDPVCSVFAFVEGSILLMSSYSYNIWALYAGYIVFGAIYHTMVTVASFFFQVEKKAALRSLNVYPMIVMA